MRGIDMSTMAAGVADGKRQVIQANQRDRMREILDRNGVLPPEPEPDEPRTCLGRPWTDRSGRAAADGGLPWPDNGRCVRHEDVL